MRPIVKMFAGLLLALIGVVSTAGMAVSSDGAVRVDVNLARILRINAPASTVIIGNPGIADVTIQDADTLILTGKSYGTTNLIVLDSVGNPIVDTMIDVTQNTSEVLTVYQGQARTSLSCNPHCQPVIMLGDDAEFMANSVASSSMAAAAAN